MEKGSVLKNLKERLLTMDVTFWLNVYAVTVFSIKMEIVD